MSWRRLAGWTLVVIAATGGACRRESQASANGPNILFILLDDLRSDAVGYAGHRYLKTPQIDRIANEGVNFRNAFCTTSLCSPSRASLLSGLYAHKHGVTNNFTEFPASLRSFPSALRDAGYTTAYIGKYHMGEDNDAPRPGFDYFVTHKGQGQYFGTEFNINGERREKKPGYYTTVVTDMALDWLQRDHGGKPWMLILGHKAPHSFYTPEEVYYYNYEKEFPYTPNVRGVRTEEWKYVHYPHGDGSPDRHMAELYHLKSDPGENVNLIADAKSAAMGEQLKAELVRLMAAAGLTASSDKMPIDAGIKTALPDQKIR
jgi:arylsulfatase A-like enzyme